MGKETGRQGIAQDPPTLASLQATALGPAGNWHPAEGNRGVRRWPRAAPTQRAEVSGTCPAHRSAQGKHRGRCQWEVKAKGKARLERGLRAALTLLL